MRKLYRRHFLGCELIFSVILMALLTFFTQHYFSFDIIKENLNNIRDMFYGTLATLSGALLGFVITGLSVLLTTSTNKQMVTLRKSKHYKTIFTIFFSTSKYLGILLMFSLVGLVFDKDASPIFILTLITLWSLLIVTFRLLRCIWVLERIVRLHVYQE